MNLRKTIRLIREEGEEKLNRLNLSLIADKRYEDLERGAQDKAFRA